MKMTKMIGGVAIDARNAFNEGNLKMMVCIARHEWPSGSRFLFNMHRHHSVLVLRDETALKPCFCIVGKGLPRVVHYL